jgi:hypothetical protein
MFEDETQTPIQGFETNLFAEGVVRYFVNKVTLNKHLARK